ncbi:uncharacterized protein LOC106013145 [Aplysia californica]|uniref:Uncharacterized protein LOC106013145 n=1 Tax=Aplysia californica TaxID=6500 RepID=A0ABM1A9S8_APLCA|nr:uncharacterized protein LOC106013145 [Aplysia californica]
MHQAFEHCGQHCREPAPTDSLASMCWPLIQQSQPLRAVETSAMSPYAPAADVTWPVSEPWRRNLGQPRCGGAGRCQGDARRCNSKYRYGVDDVGQCPSASSCRSSFSCNPCPADCPNPCPDSRDCNRLTTRCFEWPKPKGGACPVEDSNRDFRPPRPDLNRHDTQPERCPTCNRVVVDMACGPMGYNY